MTSYGKGKVVPVLSMMLWKHMGKVEVKLHIFLILALNGDEW
jgi:hypothetical protein